MDLGTSCGWAKSANGKITSGVWNLKPTKFDSHGARYLTFKRYLELEIILDNTEAIYYESVRMHRAIDAAQMYGAYVGIIQTICLENNIFYAGVPVQTIKKHATGRGNADKEQMIEAAILKFKTIDIINSDHADGLHLLDYILAH